MTDEALIQYSRDLAAEVEDAIRAGEDAVYSEEEFTRIVLDKLGDEGALDNPIYLYQEGTFGRTRYKITGFSISEAEDRLLLVTTVHTGELPPRDLTTEEIRDAVTQAANFYKCSVDGLYTKIEPSNSEASDLARRIFDIHDRIEVVRVVLISDGMSGLKSLDIKDTKDGARVLVDLYGIERLHRILGNGLTRDDIVLDVCGDRETVALPQSVLREWRLRCVHDSDTGFAVGRHLRKVRNAASGTQRPCVSRAERAQECERCPEADNPRGAGSLYGLQQRHRRDGRMKSSEWMARNHLAFRRCAGCRSSMAVRPRRAFTGHASRTSRASTGSCSGEDHHGEGGKSECDGRCDFPFRQQSEHHSAGRFLRE